MSDILRLLRRDLRQATSNTMAIIVMFGLVVIPSLFTWFNVMASWDPFSNTGDLKVAVASADTGYESDLVPLRVNIGEQVLSALRANEQLDWQITSEADAIDGTESGEYYAAIVLPPSFSTDMMTFYSDGSDPTTITYYSNEKKNALAPKITGQGAEGVSAQITEVFTQTLGDIAFGVIDELSDYLTDDQTQAALTRLEARVGSVAAQLDAGAQTADMFAALAGAGVPLIQSGQALISASGASLSDAAGAVGSGRAAVDGLQQTLSTATSSLSHALDSTAAGYDAVSTRVDELFADAGELTDARVATVRTLADSVQQQVDRYTAVRDGLVTNVGPQVPDAAQSAFDEVIARINEAIDRQQNVHDRLVAAADDAAAGGDTAQQRHKALTASLGAARDAIADARSAYTDELRPQLDALSTTLDTIDADVAAVRGDLASAASRLAADGSVTAALTGAQSAAAEVSTTLHEGADRLRKLEDAIAEAADTGDLTALSKIIGADPSTLAASLAEPVRVDRVPVYPVASFGVAMAPLYTILALFVGALLMTVAIRVDVHEGTLPGTELTPTQKYLGRYGLFALTGLAQSTLLAIGLIAFIQIDPVHPWLLLLAAWATSLVFTLITYTAVVAFGNAGKALCVLLLVIQISGSGGAYPLDLLPQWFQNISPFLPATHAIDALRSAIAGMYGADFWQALGMLALFAVPLLLLGLVLRRPLIRFNRKLIEALESTKLM
ncbi:YhgE/Pip domain-containing protein [Microbacterium sp. bgisy189]|uniref:YhgE/Pip domain-containing protein n=1 Tax=Microbacterium sp. bgisy189 TaxID=3413798 RepID=UPI003EBCD5A8